MLKYDASTWSVNYTIQVGTSGNDGFLRVHVTSADEVLVTEGAIFSMTNEDVHVYVFFST